MNTECIARGKLLMQGYHQQGGLPASLATRPFSELHTALFLTSIPVKLRCLLDDGRRSR